MKDIRIGRAVTVDPVRTVTCGGTPTLLIGPDSTRIRLVLTHVLDPVGNPAAVVWVLNQNNANTRPFWVLPPQTPSVVLDIEKFGQLVTGPIYVIEPAAGTPIVSATAVRLQNEVQ